MEMLETKDFQVADERLAAATHTSTTEGLNEDVSPSIISQFDSENELSLMHVQSFQSVFPEVVHDSPLTEDAIDTLEEAGGMIVVQLMDIRTRLSQLRTMLEKRIGSVLTDYEFWLQDSKMLESHKTLVDQCIRGEGVVQVNIQIKPLLKRINIMDVLKPDEECLEPEDMPTYGDDCSSIEEDIPINNTELDNAETLPLLSKSNRDFNNSELNNDRKTLPLKNCQWAIDARFKNDQERLKIPSNPNFWTIPQVTYWIQWAVRQFKLKGIKLSDWRMTGGELCALTIDEFKKKCPNDPVDIFWTHFELLRKCHFIAIYPVIESDDEDTPSVIKKKSRMVPVIENKVLPQYYSNTNTTTTRCGNNGQIQLWQFLLELLTSAEHRNVIQWIGGNGEFKLQNPEVVARLWGQRKNKPTMNYEKLSRALRYYYDGDMIAKVHNKRFVYRFVCDLKQLIGYDASDLARLVNLTNASNKESNSYEYWREPS